MPFPIQLNSSWARDIAILAFVFGMLYFAPLGSRPLANPDEGRYSEIPREMLESGDFVTPRLNGVRYFEKPPLGYWLTASAFKLFGHNEFASRFWCAAFALGGVLGTYAFARYEYSRSSGLWSSIVLGTSFLYLAMSQIALLDMLVSIPIAGSLFLFLVAAKSKTGKRRTLLFWMFYACMAFAVLAKGLIGVVLPSAVIFIWILSSNRWKELPRYRIPSGAIVFFAIAAPWHIAVARANPDFLQFYFIHEHFDRFTTDVHSRVEPFWYFVPIFLLGLFPWVVFLPSALISLRSKALHTSSRKGAFLFLEIWIVFILLFFSVSQSKLIPYILPVFPASAVLIGKYLSSVKLTPGKRGTTISIWLYSGFSWIMAVVFATTELPDKYADLVGEVNSWRVFLFATLMIASIATLLAYSAGKSAFTKYSIALGSIAFFFGTIGLAATLESKSTKKIAAAIVALDNDSGEVYCLGDYYQDLPVYLGRTIKVVEYEGELSFGINSQPEISRDRYISKLEFLDQWKTEDTRYAVLNRNDLEDWFEGSDCATHVVAETRRYTLVTNNMRKSTQDEQ